MENGDDYGPMFRSFPRFARIVPSEVLCADCECTHHFIIKCTRLTNKSASVAISVSFFDYAKKKVSRRFWTFPTNQECAFGSCYCNAQVIFFPTRVPTPALTKEHSI